MVIYFFGKVFPFLKRFANFRIKCCNQGYIQFCFFWDILLIENQKGGIKMKKLMKKKINVFGKTFSMFAIAMIAVIGLGAAALVPYLSNTVTGSTSVSSPLLIQISQDDSAWSDSLELSDLFGGEEITFNIKTTNQADVEISSDSAVQIIGSGDALINDNLNGSCAELEEVTINVNRDGDERIDATYTLENIDCDSEGDTMTLDMGGTTYSPGQVELMEVTAKFKQNAIGTYTFQMQEMNA